MSLDLELAVSACEAGKYDEARRLCSAQLALSPSDPRVHHLLGIVHGMQNDHATASKYLERAVTLAPATIEYRKNWCRSLLQISQGASAEQVLRDGLSQSPDSSELQKMLGIVLAQNGRVDEALEVYQRAVSRASDDPALYFGLSELQRRQGDRKGAISSLRKTLELQPRSVDALNNLAGLELASGDFVAAIQTIKEALDIAPKSAQAHYNLARLLEVAGDLPQAVIALKNALSLAPGLIAPRFLLCSLYLQTGELEAAESLTRQLLDRLGEDSVRGLASLARILERQGRLEEAQQALNRIDREDQSNPEVAVVQATLMEQRGEFRPAIDALQGVLQANAVAANEGIGIYFLLGQIYDASSQFDLAFDAFRRGNENRKNAFVQIRNDACEPESGFEILTSCYSEKLFSQCPSSSITTDVPLFIVGMPRSGTTLMEQIIASHPDAIGAGELTLVQDVLTATYPTRDARSPLEIIPADRYSGQHCTVPYGWGDCNQEDISKLANSYLSQLLAGRPAASRITDKLPYNYFLLPIIHRMFPNAKIIHCKRNALDTCLSCYFQNFSTGNRFAFDLEDLGDFYSDYYRLMDQWTRVLGVPVIEAQYEDVVSNPESEVRRILQECGLDWHAACLEFHRSERTVHTASYQQVRKPLYTSSVARSQAYMKHLQPLVDVLESNDIPYK